MVLKFYVVLEKIYDSLVPYLIRFLGPHIDVHLGEPKGLEQADCQGPRPRNDAIACQILREVL